MSDRSKSQFSTEVSSLFAPKHMAEHHNAGLDFAVTGGNTKAVGVIIDGGFDENYHPLPPSKGYDAPGL